MMVDRQHSQAPTVTEAAGPTSGRSLTVTHGSRSLKTPTHPPLFANKTSQMLTCQGQPDDEAGQHLLPC
jgi:hypothetical protein